MEKGSQPPRNAEKFFIVMGALHTAFITLVVFLNFPKPACNLLHVWNKTIDFKINIINKSTVKNGMLNEVRYCYRENQSGNFFTQYIFWNKSKENHSYMEKRSFSTIIFETISCQHITFNDRKTKHITFDDGELVVVVVVVVVVVRGDNELKLWGVGSDSIEISCRR